MALNLFYNTGIDAHNVLYFDEPWSRPGDYVLLRAITDLVCVSSSCPDDIDPANGWDPTDIHVRTYSDKQSFSRAVAYRMTPDAEPQLTRETAFHPRFSALTRNYTEYRGYWLPTRFSNDGPVAEYWACRERAAIMDLSRGYEAYMAEEGRESRRLVKSIKQKRRKLEREHGEITFSFDTPCEQTLELLMRFKSDQYRRSGRTACRTRT